MINAHIHVDGIEPMLRDPKPFLDLDCNGSMASGFIRLMDYGVGHDGLTLTIGRYDDNCERHDIASVRLWHTRSLRELRAAIDSCLLLRACDGEGDNPHDEK